MSLSNVSPGSSSHNVDELITSGPRSTTSQEEPSIARLGSSILQSNPASSSGSIATASSQSSTGSEKIHSVGITTLGCTSSTDDLAPEVPVKAELETAEPLFEILHVGNEKLKEPSVVCKLITKNDDQLEKLDEKAMPPIWREYKGHPRCPPNECDIYYLSPEYTTTLGPKFGFDFKRGNRFASKEPIPDSNPVEGELGTSKKKTLPPEDRYLYTIPTEEEIQEVWEELMSRPVEMGVDHKQISKYSTERFPATYDDNAFEKNGILSKLGLYFTRSQDQSSYGDLYYIPKLDYLVKKWDELRSEGIVSYPLKLCIVNGIVDDFTFVQLSTQGVILISEGIDYCHDITAHLIRRINLLLMASSSEDASDDYDDLTSELNDYMLQFLEYHDDYKKFSSTAELPDIVQAVLRFLKLTDQTIFLDESGASNAKFYNELMGFCQTLIGIVADAAYSANDFQGLGKAVTKLDKSDVGFFVGVNVLDTLPDVSPYLPRRKHGKKLNRTRDLTSVVRCYRKFLSKKYPSLELNRRSNFKTYLDVFNLLFLPEH